MTDAVTTHGGPAGDLWARFQEVGCEPEFEPGEAGLIIDLYRRLARDGTSIRFDEAVRMAGDHGVGQEGVRSIIENSAELSADGSIRGIAGLSLNQHPYAYHIGDVTLHSWCALDPLFIVPLLGVETTVESVDPAGGEVIRVQISPEAVRSHDLSHVVISIVVPEGDSCCGVESTWSAFCNHVHFFKDRLAATRFFSAADQEVAILTLDEAFQLGRLTHAALFQQLEATKEGVS